MQGTKVKRLVRAGVGSTLSFLLLMTMIGCGGEVAPVNEDTGGQVTTPEPTEPAEIITVNVACRNDYQEIWDAVNAELADDGIKVINTAYDTSVNLNDLLVEGDIELNVAQHYAALEYIKGSDAKFADLTAIGDIHISTLDLYSNKHDSIEALPQGAVIAIPNDFMNGGRALNVLATSGAITLRSDAPALPTADDIIDNPKGFVFQDIASDMMVRVLDDVDAGFVYAVNAVDGGLDPNTDAIYNDIIDFTVNPNEKLFIIIFTARGEDANNPTYQKIVEAYHSPSVQKVYQDVYGGTLIPIVDNKPIDVSSK
jgi:D-methionine transport system substrate-binding protein